MRNNTANSTPASAFLVPSRFYSLDAIRGGAALAVVMWHWQHFWFKGTAMQETLFDKTAQPLYGIFFLLYKQGFRAVDLFFSLSGFIFFWLYQDKLRTRTISARKFSILRLSRLYPLHIVTLVSVLVLQVFVVKVFGEYFIYEYNDLRHFFLHFFMVSDWGLQVSHSFNGPFWSVSIEVLLYGVFFVVCRFCRSGVIVPSLLIFLGGCLLLQDPMNHYGRGLFAFFTGGMSYLLYARLVKNGKISAARKYLCCLGIIFWVSVFVTTWWELQPFYSIVVNPLFTDGLLFPVTILTAVTLETERGTFGKRISLLGDISYSSYLIHFPLQLVVIVVATWFSLPKSIFYSPAIFTLFYAVLITLSLGAFHYVEKPLQRYIRLKYLKEGTK